MKRFVPYPSDARVGSSGLASVRVLMQDGVWLVPPGERPIVEPPQETTKAEQHVFRHRRNSFQSNRVAGG